MDTHVKVLGWVFVVFGVFYVLMGFGSSMVMGLIATIVGAQGGDEAAVAVPILGFVGTAGLIFWLTIGIPGIIAGWGLLNRKPWARVLAIILSAIGLINVPVGTAVGIYGLWVLFHKDTESLF